MLNIAKYTPPVPAMKGLAGYKVMDQRTDELFKQFRNMQLVENETEKFKQTMRSVENGGDVVNNYRAFNTMLSAYGLERFDYANNLVKRALNENIDNPDAMANRLKDPAFKQMAKDFQDYVTARDTGNDKLAEGMLEKMTGKYLQKKFEESVGREAPAVAQAMRFKRTIGNAKFMYDVVGDLKNYEVIRKAFQIPREIVNQDIESQKERLKQVTSLEELKSADKQDEIIKRFLLFSQMDPPTGVKPGGTDTGSIAVQMLGGSGSGTSEQSAALQILGDSGGNQSGSLLSATTLSALNQGGF